MSLHRGWGQQPPQNSSHIHMRHIQRAWAHLYAVHGNMAVSSISYTHLTWLRFWGTGSLVLVELKWWHSVIVEGNSHLKLLPAFILGIYKLFEHIDMLSIGIRWQLTQFYPHYLSQIVGFSHSCKTLSRLNSSCKSIKLIYAIKMYCTAIFLVKFICGTCTGLKHHLVKFGSHDISWTICCPRVHNVPVPKKTCKKLLIEEIARTLLYISQVISCMEMVSWMLLWNEGHPQDLRPPWKQAPRWTGASPRQPQWGSWTGLREDNHPCPSLCRRTSSCILQPATKWLSSTIQKVPTPRTLWRRQLWCL